MSLVLEKAVASGKLSLNTLVKHPHLHHLQPHPCTHFMKLHCSFSIFQLVSIYVKIHTFVFREWISSQPLDSNLPKFWCFVYYFFKYRILIIRNIPGNSSNSALYIKADFMISLDRAKQKAVSWICLSCDFNLPVHLEWS